MLMTVLVSLAALLGFVLEWRRDRRIDQIQGARLEAHEGRLLELDARLAEVESWRERTQRAQ